MNEQVPEGWVRHPLTDICFFQEGPGLRNWQYTDSGTKFINIRCIKDGDINLSVAQHLSSQEVDEKYQHFLLDEGDYVLSSSGTIGRLAEVKKRHLPLLLNTSVIRFRSKNSELLDHLFLRHFLQSGNFFDKVSEQSQGSAQVNFGPTHLKLIDAILPPLPEQKKIASVLTSVDEVIENTRAQINKLQDLKKALMQNLLTKGIGHTKFKNSELGQIPKNWEKTNFGKYAKVLNGYAFKSSDFTGAGIGKYPVIRMSNLKKGSVDLTGSIYIDKNLVEGLDKFKLQAGDFVFGMSGSISNYGVICENNGTCYQNQRVGRLQPVNSNPNFIPYLFKSVQMSRQIEALAAGAAQANISPSQIEGMEIYLPPLPEQKKIASILTSVDEMIENTQAQINKLQDLKKALMQDLLTGKVRIPS